MKYLLDKYGVMKWIGQRWLSENEKAGGFMTAKYSVIWSSLRGFLCKRRTTVPESLRSFCRSKAKGQVHPKTGHEGPKME